MTVPLECKNTGFPIPTIRRSQSVVTFEAANEATVGEHPEEARRYVVDAGVFCSARCLTEYLLGVVLGGGEDPPCRVADLGRIIASTEEPF